MKNLSLKASLLFLLLLLITSGCQQDENSDELTGRVTLWHSWSESEAAVLDEALNQFQEIHPEVRIIPVALSEEIILEEFVAAGKSGFGPDLIIGPDDWVGELADLGLLRSLSPEFRDSQFFNSRNTELIQYEGDLYGVPLSLAPRALYYNKEMVTELPTTLEGLLEEAAAGNQAAFVPRFEEAYWGIRAFGEGLFDDQDRLSLAESGFADWLAWLDQAQKSPGMILNVDDASLLQLFATGQIAYYVGGPDKLDDIEALLDEENPIEYGVAPLPNGPEGLPAGPLLPADTIMRYAFTSERQSRIADELSRYLSNQQQSVRFMRELGRVPANPSVVVDSRLYPLVSGFARQARNGVVIPNEVPTNPLLEAGDRAYISALSGALTPEEAVCRFGIEVVVHLDYSAAEMNLLDGCEVRE